MIQQSLGVLGGGQLGAMLIQSAIGFGIRVSVLELDREAPCSLYATHFVHGDPLSYDDVLAFGQDLDIITIEKEAVNVDALRALRDMGKKVFPSPEIIAMVQDKYVQKQFLQQAGIPVVPGVLVSDRSALPGLLKSFPACLKLCREGYDGRGVVILRSEADMRMAFDAPSVLEEFVPIGQEVSVIVARSATGEVRLYDPVSMVFDNKRNILDYQLCPASLTDEQVREANDLAIRVARAADLVGIMAVEMFVTREGRVVVNELAPRPHNSGHHTIEASITSQYEQLLRAVFGLALGDTTTTFPSAMVNILGRAETGSTLQQSVASLLTLKGVHIHWYAKKEKHGRKLGHVTIKDHSLESVLATADSVRTILNN